MEALIFRKPPATLQYNKLLQIAQRLAYYITKGSSKTRPGWGGVHWGQLVILVENYNQFLFDTLNEFRRFLDHSIFTVRNKIVTEI